MLIIAIISIANGSSPPAPAPAPAFAPAAFFEPFLKDAHNSCNDWAASGECTRNADFMLENCGASCAVDKHDSCSLWSVAGECQTNAGYMRVNCPKSCSAPVQPPPPAPSLPVYTPTPTPSPTPSPTPDISHCKGVILRGAHDIGKYDRDMSGTYVKQNGKMRYGQPVFKLGQYFLFLKRTVRFSNGYTEEPVWFLGPNVDEAKGLAFTKNHLLSNSIDPWQSHNGDGWREDGEMQATCTTTSQSSSRRRRQIRGGSYGHACYRQSTGRTVLDGTVVDCVKPIGKKCKCDNGQWIAFGYTPSSRRRRSTLLYRRPVGVDPIAVVGRPVFHKDGSAALPQVVWETCGPNSSTSGVRTSISHARTKMENTTAPQLPFPEPDLLTAEHWVEVARGEYASVAAFNRFSLELMRIGAASSLLAWAQKAAMEEVGHAEQAFALAATLNQSETVPKAAKMVELDSVPAIRTSLEEVLLAVYNEGCIAEARAAEKAAAQLSAVQTWLMSEPTCNKGGAGAGATWECAAAEQVKVVLQLIATEEAGHAELSWRTMEWGLTQLSVDDAREKLGESVVEAVWHRAQGHN